MAEQKQEIKQEKKQDKSKDKSQSQTEKVAKGKPQELQNEILVRIFGYDIPGSRNIYAGLTRIKGVSWMISNVVCLKLGFPRTKKISEISKDDIKKIENFLKTIDIPNFMKNRRSDLENGTVTHLYGTDLDVVKDFDIKRQKKMKSYVGIRHIAGQPVRGQRTKSHFRKRDTKPMVKKATAAKAGAA